MTAPTPAARTLMTNSQPRQRDIDAKKEDQIFFKMRCRSRYDVDSPKSLKNPRRACAKTTDETRIPALCENNNDTSPHCAKKEMQNSRDPTHCEKNWTPSRTNQIGRLFTPYGKNAKVTKKQAKETRQNKKASKRNPSKLSARTPQNKKTFKNVF